tara:strand:- start:2957 stop:5170 length:2214 start_codon:yes stop_codon:yes gene_type:complete
MTNYSEVKVANSAKGTLAGGISANQGTLSLLGGEGAKFPTLNTGEYFYITVTSAALATNTEIMRVTSRSADTLTIKQADGSARNLNNTFSAGDSVEVRTTANAINDLFDLENILPDVPAQPDKFGFRVGGTVDRYIGPNGVLSAATEDEDRKFAIKSDGANATYEALNPNDISDDNNTNTGFVSIPVRTHPYIPHVRGNEMYKIDNLVWNGGAVVPIATGTYSEQNLSTNANLYQMNEDHNIPIQEGSLVHLNNIVKVDPHGSSFGNPYGINQDSFHISTYGVHFTAYTTTNAVNSNIISFNAVKFEHNISQVASNYTARDAALAPGTNNAAIFTVDVFTNNINWQERRFIGSYLYPPAVNAGLTNVPPGTYIVQATRDTSTTGTGTTITVTLNQNVTVPAATRIQFYRSRFLQLGKHYSASRQDTVYYKRDNTAPASQSLNSDTVPNIKEDAYMPVPGQIANVYICTGHNHAGSGRISSTQYNFDHATNETNGDYQTLAGDHFGVTVKPISKDSVFTIKFSSTVYKNADYGALIFYCDYIDEDPQPNNTRIYKNPNDNTTAKAVFLVGRHMHIDRFRQPEFNLNFIRNNTDDGQAYAVGDGLITAGTWPNNNSAAALSPQANTHLADSNDYVSHNDGANVNGTDDNNFFAGMWHLNAHVHAGIGAIQYFRPGVTSKVRFRCAILREANTGTVYLQYVDGSNTTMIVEENVHPYGSFGFDIPGGLDTTAHWNGNVVR